MKTIKDIKEEYKEYKIKTDYVNTLEDFIAFLDVGIDDVDENISEYSTEIHGNKKDYVLACIKSFFPMFFEDEETDCFEYDIELLEQEVSLAYTQKDYYKAMKNIATEKNYKELLRLLDFAIDYYVNHINYIETLRDIVALRFQGYTMYNSKYQDNRKSFHQFFIEKMNELTPHMVVEKSIKM